MSDNFPSVHVETRRLVQLGAVLVAASLIGFFSVLRDREEPRGFAEPRAAAEVSAQRAESYAQLRSSDDPTGAGLHALGFKGLREALPAATAGVEQTPQDRESALAVRAQRRAFNGAPPTIPHVVDQMAKPNCLVCHESGLVIDGKIAPMMSHPPMNSCLQCHAVAIAPEGLSVTAFAGNDFEGVGFAQKGARAWQGAPPSVPHSSLMRENCGSCHGVSGRLGMRSTHPQRQSCTQCHALSAELDQRLFAGRNP